MESIIPDSSVILRWLIDYSIDTSIIIGLIFVIRSITKKFPAWWHYTLWLILLLFMVVPLEFEKPANIPNVVPASIEENLYEFIFIEQKSAPPEFRKEASILPQEISTNQPVTNVQNQQNTQARHIPVNDMLLLIWLASAVSFGMLTLIKNIQFWNTIRKEPPVTAEKVLRLMEECKARMRSHTPLTIIITDKVKSPALFGYIHPRLLLPVGILEKLDETELAYIFMHELGHIKRHDVAMAWLIILLQAIHWFNPLVWFSFHIMKVDQESACDDFVLSRIRPGQSKDYGNAIVGFLDKFRRNRKVPALAGIVENKSQIKRRMRMIINYRKYSKMKMVFTSVLLIFICLVFFSLTGFSKESTRPAVSDSSNIKEITIENQMDSVVPQVMDVVEKKEVKRPVQKTQEGPDAVQEKVAKEKKEIVRLAAVSPKNSVAGKAKDIKPEALPLKFDKKIKKAPAMTQNKADVLNNEKTLIAEEVARVQPVEKDKAALLYESSLNLFNDGKYNQAISRFESFLKTYPKSNLSDNAQFWIGECYMGLKQYERAILEFNKVIKNYPDENKVPNAMFRQSVAMLKIGELKGAKVVLKNLIKLYPKSPEAAVAKKKVILIESDAEELNQREFRLNMVSPDKAYEINRTYKPGNFSRQCELAMVEAQKYFEKGNYSEARKVLLDYLAKNPETEKVLQPVSEMLGYLWLIEGETEEARKIYKEAYEGYPDEYLLERYAFTSYKSGHYKEAAHLYERLYDTGKDKNVTRLDYAAQSNIKLKNWKEAKRLYQRMIGLPANPEKRWFKNIIALCKHLNQTEEAENYKKQLDELSKPAWVAQKTPENKAMKDGVKLTELDMSMSRFNTAPQDKAGNTSKAYDRKRTGNPVRLTREDQIAMVAAQKYLEKGNYREAIQVILGLLDYRAKKSETEKISDMVYLMLGYCYLQEGEKEEARKVFKVGYETNPDNLDLLAYYAATSYEAGHYEEASPLFERFYDIDMNKDVRRLEHAAQSSIEIKNWEEAKRLLKRLLDLPGKPEQRWLKGIIVICNLLNQPEDAETYKKQLNELYGNQG